FLFRRSVPQCHADVEFECTGPSQRSQRSNRGQTPGLQIESRPRPNAAGDKLEDKPFQVRRDFPPPLTNPFRFRVADHRFQRGQTIFKVLFVRHIWLPILKPYPALTSMACPVIALASGEQRKSTRSATSSGRTIRLNAVARVYS